MSHLGIQSVHAVHLSDDEIIKKFQSNKDIGLSFSNVQNFRISNDTFNEFKAEDEDSWVDKIIDQFKDPLILLLLGSALISCILGQYDDAISITLAIIIVLSVAFVQEYRSEQSLSALKNLVPPRCNIIRDGDLINMEARELIPGDICNLRAGDRVPADMRILSSVDLQIDESSLTGESEPRLKHSGYIQKPHTGDISLSERSNCAFMGTLVREGHGLGIVICVGEDSEFGTVFHMMQSVEEKRTPLQLKMDYLGKQLSVFSFGIIFVIVLIGWLQNKPTLEMFTVGVSLAVAAIPEGLPIVVTVTLALGVIRISKKHAIVRHLPAVETLGCTNVICVDKTGTLTENVMTVVTIAPYNNQIFHVTSPGSTTSNTQFNQTFNINSINNVPNGNNNNGKHNNGGRIPSSGPSTVTDVLLAGSVCSNAYIAPDNQVIGQPTEGAIVLAGKKHNVSTSQYIRVNEIPFSSGRKWMAVQCRERGVDLDSNANTSSSDVDENLIWFMKGSCSSVLAHCDISEMEKQAVIASVESVSKQGLRVIAMARGTDMHSLRYIGHVGIQDPPRVGVLPAIRKLHSNGVRVTMITGDAKETAISIATALDLFDPSCHSATSGKEVDAMSPEQLSETAMKTTVFYRTSPKHKLLIVEAYQRCGYVVAMTGDGVNDAPALKAADIGVSMGITGTDVSKEAADVVLVNDQFATILDAIEEGKGIFHNIRHFVRFQLSTSIAALTLVAVCTIAGYHNPLNAMQILWINIIMDGPPAQSLGVEPVTPSIMNLPPRMKSESIVTRFLLLKTVTSALVIVSGTLFIFISNYEEVLTHRVTTLTFTTFVMFDMFNAVSCRSMTDNIYKIGFFSNRMFLYAVGFSILGQLLVIYIPFLQRVFQTEALSLSDLIHITAVASSVFWVDETMKYFFSNFSSLNLNLNKQHSNHQYIGISQLDQSHVAVNVGDSNNNNSKMY